MTQRRTRRGGNAPIRIKAKNAGKMRKTTGTKTGRRIPLSKLRRLKKSKNPLTRRRATFAMNVRTGKIGGKR